ncbi:MAG: S-methyl-5-thioribose-1-phosphate isomerase [Phycisphaerae bacterium]
MTLPEETVKSGLPRTLAWVGNADGELRLLDQTLLPGQVQEIACTRVEQVWEAIRALRVRGAPAIGVAAAYGVCIGTRAAQRKPRAEFLAQLGETVAYLNGARPTAVNLSWATARMSLIAAEAPGDSAAVWSRLLDEAHAIAREDEDVCRRIGEVGESLIFEGAGVLTHCNAGALATVAHGTALSPMYAAHRAGRRFRVYADETRPLLQGARLTAFELSAAGIDVCLLCDSAAASVMRGGQIQLVIVGADRIAANGDTANKIGTYSVALSAKHHGIPFYVAAPLSTFDARIASGAEIPIEQRDGREVRELAGREVAVPGVACVNPAFDVTPANLISGIITEKGLLKPVTEKNIRLFLGREG